jgi:hypothetical protein
MRSAIVIGALCLLIPRSVGAQLTESIGPGSRVRVVSAVDGTSQRQIGTVLAIDSTGLALIDRNGDTHVVEGQMMVSLERSLGRRAEPVVGALAGAAGAGVYFLMRALLGASMGSEWEMEACSTGCVAGTVGAFVGIGVLAAHVRPRERWAAIAPSGAKAALGMQLSF